MMRIAEVFHSVQGEGALVGMPSVFVRTSGCNLRCSWCDTPYTSWEPEGEMRSVDSVVAEVAAFHAAHAVITGGEPMLVAELPDLTARLHARGMHITIETAGTLYLPVACDLMSISPKLANSTPAGRFAGMHENTRLQPDVLKRLIADYAYQLKFVVSAPGDMDEIVALVESLGVSPSSVILMPEGIDRDLLRERSLWLVDLCRHHGYRFTPRLHVDLWGSRRAI